MRWHVQVMGSGPPLLLLHGTGAATHSWRDLMPMLAQDFTVIAPDLPGHGFTETPGGDGLSLRGMARELAALLGALGLQPALAVGHSAGAAIAIRMRLDGRLDGRLGGSGGRGRQPQWRAAAVSGRGRPYLSGHGQAAVPEPRGDPDLHLARQPPGRRRPADREHRLRYRRARPGRLRGADENQRPCRRRPRHDGAMGPCTTCNANCRTCGGV